jgi:uncharacterized protein YggE
MKTSLIKKVALVALPIIALTSAPAQAAEATRYITVSAEGTVKVTPDAVRLTSTVSYLGTTSKDALAQVAKSANAVRSALKNSAIATKDIATQTVTVYPEYNYTQDKGQVLTGYRASQTFVVVIRAASTAGDVVDAVATSGGENTQINSVTPFVLDPTKATATARAAAVKNAKAKATSYASLLGVKLGRINYLVENGSPSISAPIYSMAKDSASSTVIDLGQQDVTVSITVQWGL